MRLAAPRTSLLTAGAVAAALLLSGCSGDSAADAAPAPAPVLPSPVQKLVTTTDVGEYFVTPRAGVTKEAVAGTVAKLKTMEGVQSATIRKDGSVDLVFRGDPSAKAREAAVKQLAALGDVQEGV